MNQENESAQEDMRWITDIWVKIEKKMDWVTEKTKNIIPYTTDINGNYVDIFEKLPAMWTNGFWPGMMWLLYKGTGKDKYKETAESTEKMLDQALYLKNGIAENLDHDTGFLWHISAVADYKITGNPDSRRRGIIAANNLMSRYNPKAGFLTAWNLKERQGWSIIDTMMNLPLLYWAYEETGAVRYRDIAMCHADKTMEHIIRQDGSSAHIAVYNVENGELTAYLAGQGAGPDSAWSRGQGWAIYGFALSYRYSGNKSYLDTAIKVAHYYMEAMAKNQDIPPSDFRGSKNKQLMDTTSAVIAVNGVLELSNHVDALVREKYRNWAAGILKKMVNNYCNFSDASDAILQKSSERCTDEKEMTIIYGDFFLVEAVLKLRGSSFRIW